MDQKEEKYWNALISMVAKALNDENNSEAASVVRKGKFEIRWIDHDNWNGGIDYYALVFRLKFQDFLLVESQRDVICNDILKELSRFHNDESGQIVRVEIEPIVERILDWKTIIPEGKESTIKLIQDERDQLMANATGQQSYKEDGVNQAYKERHNKILARAKKVGFEYDVPYNDLTEWWVFVKKIDGYAERRAYINKVFDDILKPILESQEEIQGAVVDFKSIYQKSRIIDMALREARVLIQNESFSAATDRVHTAFHGYLRELLKAHDIDYNESDTLSQLYSKLHNFYGSIIQPPEVADLVKTALRSASGVIFSINEIRNKHTTVHPNNNLIQEREAKLMIQLVKAITDYLENIEAELVRQEKGLNEEQ